MMPMQPFQFDQAASVQSTPNVRRELPARVKTVLGLKVIACLLAIGGSFIMLAAFSDPSKLPVNLPAEWAHRMAKYAMMSTGLSLLELLGVAGVWSFKRWGVYLLAGFSMFNFVVRMQSGDSTWALIGLASTAIVGAVVWTRWKDFE